MPYHEPQTTNILRVLQDQGHDPLSIERVIGGIRTSLAARGLSNYKIDQKLGIAPFDTSKFQEFMVNAAREKFGERASGFTREVFTLDDFFSAGFEQSTLSLAFDSPTEEGKKALAFQDKTLAQDVASMSGTVGGDIPAMGAGWVIGTGTGIMAAGPLGVITGFGAAFALPEVLRTVMMDAYENGHITSWKHFWDLLIETGINTSKAYLTGALTGVASVGTKAVIAKLLPTAPAVVPKAASLTAEVATFTTVGAALEGRVPEPREFLLGATVILGLKAGLKSAGFVAQKSRNIYRRVGKRPVDMTEDIAENPSIREDLASENIKIPRAYENPAESILYSDRHLFKAPMFKSNAEAKAYLDEVPVVSVSHGSTVSVRTVKLRPDRVGFHVGTSEQALQRGEWLIEERVSKGWDYDPQEVGNMRINRYDVHTADITNPVYLAEGVDFGVIDTITRQIDSFEQFKDMHKAGYDPREAYRIEARETLEMLNIFDGVEIDSIIEKTLRDMTPENATRVLNEALADKGVNAILYHNEAHLEGEGLSMAVLDPKILKKTVTQKARYDENEGVFVPMNLPKVRPKVRVEAEAKVEDPVDVGPKAEAMTPTERVLARISIGAPGAKKPGWLSSLHKIYENVWDDLHPLSSTVKALRNGEKLPANEDPYILSRNLRGVSGVGDSFLEYGALDYATKSRISEPYQDIVRPIDQRGRLNDFRAYVVSKRVIELDKRGIETGIDVKDARLIVKKGKKEFDVDAKREGVYQEHVLRYLRDSGMISHEAFDAMREANKDFVPFNRVMDGNPTGGVGLRPIKGIVGSPRMIVDPIESIIKNTYVLTTMAERNRVMNALVELSESRPDLKVARKKKATTTVTKVESKELLDLLEPYLGKGEKAALSEADISIYRSKVFLNDKDIIRYKDGRAEIYEIDADLARAMAALDREGLSAIVKILAMPASLLRAGAIANPEFMARNLVKDTVSAYLFGKDIFIPAIDTLIGIGHVLGRTNMYKDWVAAGGQFAHIQAIDRTYHQFGLKELLRSLPARNLLKNPVEILRAISGVAEQATRVQVFAKRYRKAVGKEGKPRIEAVTEAAFEARDVTLDFQKFGSKLRGLNAISAFLNAFLQAPDKLVRAFIHNPTAMTVKIFGGLVLPSILLHLAQRDEPWYQELADWERDLYWNIGTGKEFLPDGNRNPDFIIYKIPKPFDPGLMFATGAERMVEWAIGDDPQAARDFLKTMAKSVVPNAIPQALGVPLEAYFNRSIFLDRPIVPRDRVGLLPELQHGIYTSETAKQIAKFIGVLPVVGDTVLASGAIVEHIIRGWTGGLGKHVLDLIDHALISSGLVPDNVLPTPAQLTNIPLVKAFVARHPSLSTKSIERFYQVYARQEMIINSYKALMAEGNFDRAREIFTEAHDGGGVFRLEQQRQAMANLSKAIRSINRFKTMPGMTRDQLAMWKRENIDVLYFRMNQLAIVGLKIAKAFEKSIDK